jgi:hypothetical protein
MAYIVNEVTEKVHKQCDGRSELSTECGVTYQMDGERSKISVSETLPPAEKCGRCFEDGGGY